MEEAPVERMNNTQVWLRNFNRAGHHKKNTNGNIRNEKDGN